MTRFTARPGGWHPSQDEHPSVRVARDLRGIADSWGDLTEALGTGSGGRGEKTHRRKLTGSPMPLRGDVTDLIAEVSSWAYFLTRVLDDETAWVPPWAPPVLDVATIGRGGIVRYCAALRIHARRPPVDVPEMLRAVALRVGHFTEHPDHGMRAAVEDDAAKWRKEIRNVLEPTGARWVRTRVPCQEAGTDEHGKRVPCKGEYRVLLVPGKDDLGDMVCKVDKEHRLTPLDWQRAQKRRMTPEQVAEALMAAIRA